MAPVLSPYQIMAADVVGTDGRVTSADALAILKMAVGLPGAPAPGWMFVDEERDFYDETTGTFTLDRNHTTWDPTINVSVQGDTTANLVGVLKGDVNGSWTPPANTVYVESLAPNYFATLAQTLNTPQAQWGIV